MIVCKCISLHIDLAFKYYMYNSAYQGQMSCLVFYKLTLLLDSELTVCSYWPLHHYKT